MRPLSDIALGTTRNVCVSHRRNSRRYQYFQTAIAFNHVRDFDMDQTGNKLTKIKATYDIPLSSSDGFFNAYTSALNEAFTDFIVDNPELVQVLGETFEQAVEEYK
jgi:hypothetical protein